MRRSKKLIKILNILLINNIKINNIRYEESHYIIFLNNYEIFINNNDLIITNLYNEDQSYFKLKELNLLIDLNILK